MNLTANQRRLLDRVALTATPLAGIFFRSVEFRWMHPDDVISGEGAVRFGGRFAAIGTRAVYASDSEETLLREIRGRKGRLGGGIIIPLDRYPRIIFRIDIKVERHVSFAQPLKDGKLDKLRERSLDPGDIGFSQAVGKHLEAQGVQAILFASVTGAGTNIVAFPRNTNSTQITLFNRAAVIAKVARWKKS